MIKLMNKKFLLLILFMIASAPLFAQDLFSAVGDNDIAGIKYLIGNGADVNKHDYHGDTPLLLAVRNGEERATTFLVEKDAKINVKDRQGNTPLILAGINGDNKAIAVLIEHGADLNTKNKK